MWLVVTSPNELVTSYHSGHMILPLNLGDNKINKMTFKKLSLTEKGIITLSTYLWTRFYLHLLHNISVFSLPLLVLNHLFEHSNSQQWTVRFLIENSKYYTLNNQGKYLNISWSMFIMYSSTSKVHNRIWLVTNLNVNVSPAFQGCSSKVPWILQSLN